jgi:hypothetical protein
MPVANLALLALVVVAFIVFMAILAWNVGHRIKPPRLD